MAGPEIPTEHLAALERSLPERGIGQVFPLCLRHRGIAVFLIERTADGALDVLAWRAGRQLQPGRSGA